MNKFSRFILVALVLVFTLALTAPSFAQDPVTIEWWHISTQEDQAAYWQGLADAFIADHPNVTINITILDNADYKQRLNTVMQAGEAPDLFQSWGGGVLWEFAKAGLVRNIGPELEGEWKDTFAAQAALELYGKDGEYYGVPWDWGAVGMFYNKALFTQAGLDPENPPATWAELLDAVQTFKDAGITPIALGELEKWPGHFWWVYLAIREGGEEAFLKAFTREGSFADEPFVKAGEDLAALVALDPFPEGFLGLGYGDQETVMGNGQAAMELMGQWSPSSQVANSESGEGIGDDLGWFPFPMVDGGAGNAGDVMGGGNGIAVGSNAPDEAVEFLQFITTEEAQRAGAFFFLPVVNGIEDLYVDDPVTTSILTARNDAPYFQLYYDQFLPPAVGGAVLDAVEALFAGMGSPEDAAAMIEESASFELE